MTRRQNSPYLLKDKDQTKMKSTFGSILLLQSVRQEELTHFSVISLFRM